MPRRFAFTMRFINPATSFPFGPWLGFAQHPASNTMLPPVPIQQVDLTPYGHQAYEWLTQGTLLGAPSDSPARMRVTTPPHSPAGGRAGQFAIAHHAGMPRIPGTDIYLAGHFQAHLHGAHGLTFTKVSEDSHLPHAPQEAPRAPRYEPARNSRKPKRPFQPRKGRYGADGAHLGPYGNTEPLSGKALVPIVLSAVVGWVMGRSY